MKYQMLPLTSRVLFGQKVIKALNGDLEHQRQVTNLHVKIGLHNPAQDFKSSTLPIQPSRQVLCLDAIKPQVSRSGKTEVKAAH